MEKAYLPQNVYDAAQERLKFIFDEFDNIYISFSGGKDSGLVLSLVLRYMQDHGISRRIGVFHQDFEAQYQETSDYVERVFTSLPDWVDKFWCCIPMRVENSLSVYEPYWYTWDDQEPEVWARPMPDYPYVYNIGNHSFAFYNYRMPEERFHDAFTGWYQAYCGGGKTVGLLGMRADESQNRNSAITRKKHMYQDVYWTTEMCKDCYIAYPIYDWTVEDVWIAYGKHKFDYNHLYDLFYRAGVPLHDIRVSSPFVHQGRSCLNAYKAIDPQMWAKLLERVQGANFGALYGATGAVGWRGVDLPQGHTWESFAGALLDTLPPELRERYTKKQPKNLYEWRKLCAKILKNDHEKSFTPINKKRDPEAIKEKYRRIARGEDV